MQPIYVRNGAPPPGKKSYPAYIEMYDEDVLRAFKARANKQNAKSEDEWPDIISE